MPTSSLIQLNSGKDQATINPFGFKIENLTLNGFNYLNSFTRLDNKESSSHPCLPILGPETNTNYQLHQHGDTRNRLGEVIEQDANYLKICHTVEEGLYPKGLIFEQIFRLEDKVFQLENNFINNSDEALPLNFAEHFYWNTPDGWDNLKINDENVADLVKSDQGFVWQEENIIEIPGLPNIILKQTNLPYVQLWTGRDESRYDKKYVCIEPARGKPRSNYFGSPASMINPRQNIQTKIEISIK